MGKSQSPYSKLKGRVVKRLKNFIQAQNDAPPATRMIIEVESKNEKVAYLFLRHGKYLDNTKPFYDKQNSGVTAKEMSSHGFVQASAKMKKLVIGILNDKLSQGSHKIIPRLESKNNLDELWVSRDNLFILFNIRYEQKNEIETEKRYLWGMLEQENNYSEKELYHLLHYCKVFDSPISPISVLDDLDFIMTKPEKENRRKDNVERASIFHNGKTKTKEKSINEALTMEFV